MVSIIVPIFRRFLIKTWLFTFISCCSRFLKYWETFGFIMRWKMIWN